MFKKLFGKKTREENITAPLTGRIFSLENVPDPVFSQKMMGEGFAIEPTNGEVVAPIDGEIVQLFHTKHAIGLKTENGAEIIIHVGLETVAMEGDGFTAHVKEGSKVKKGDKLLTVDLEKVREKAKSTVTPVVVTNSADSEKISLVATDSVIKGETVCMTVTMK
ncbi:PTS sugar transporter subunit IIA [Priestia filamentosa]|uniref:PTS glucose transporter subunit IIA n=1 Tax=Priestia filamentosa TaxID=1402861 RepID=A0A1X7F7G3_9BACI|nr:PTS glucose transporter subunit IIA [Priestia filamentosa]AKO91749.1 PTS glucose transporter subunit IIA [Priestia filamentosa]MDT3761886.1 PTS glucose transporter subunit IIA [Priestia filamentosa]OXS67972.1 PTS glucose transporter subunit IIA [Priestia filamentosa]RJS64827.1 PTS glucose transporter subunit IIA [Priestia filamentosa]WCM16975.1 PTS glucose transporter subunit IIA [Priestia filamentosa]